MRFPDHRWVDIPHTKYERRREDVVRETAFTAMAINRKYFDIDTGKFINDKISTIESCPLYDIFSEDQYSHGNYDKHFGEFHTPLKEYEKADRDSRIVPPARYYDDEFEEEPVKCSDEEYQRKLKEIDERLKTYAKQDIITPGSRICYTVSNKWIPK